MNTHPITAELRQHAENFQNSGHSDYRQHETDMHHRVRDHAINVIDSSLTQKPELREASSTERLERDIDTFAGAVWGISQELQQGISNPARFREALRDKAKAYDIAVPRPRDVQGLTPSEIVAYLKVEERDILDKKDRDDLEIYAVNVVGNLVDMWRKRAQTESQLSISEFMYSALDRPERNDLQRVRDISRKIGEEVLSFATGRLQGSSSQSETSERPNTNTPEIKLNPELYAAVMEISKNNTLINASVSQNSGARPISKERLVDGANIIGDAKRIPSGWFLPDKVVEETSYLPGLHIQQDPALLT